MTFLWSVRHQIVLRALAKSFLESKSVVQGFRTFFGLKRDQTALRVVAYLSHLVILFRGVFSLRGTIPGAMLYL